MAAQDTLLNGRYKLIAQQASGGMAVVYKAQDMALGRTVAIKVLRPSLTSDPAFLARFKQEARNVANLAHPNIVTVHDFGQDGNTYYIVMEFIEGQDLKKLIRAQAPFTVERSLNIAIQICAGVGYAHRAGLVHADVKPQNVLITPDDRVKVTDFGIAQALSATQPQEKQSVVWGSPHYFAPEQASGEIPTPASDVYSIGIVIFEMLTAKLPYNGVDQQELALAHIRDTVPHVMDFNPRVPVHLDRIIYKVMAKDPSARYRTADQLGRILISYKQQGSEPTMNQPVVEPPVQAPPPQQLQTPQLQTPAPVSPTQGQLRVPVIPSKPSQLLTPTSANPPVTPAPQPTPAIRQAPPAQYPNYNNPVNNLAAPYTPPASQQPARTGNTGPLQPPYAQSAQQPQSQQPPTYNQQPGYGQPSYGQPDYASAPDADLSKSKRMAPEYQISTAPSPIDSGVRNSGLYRTSGNCRPHPAVDCGLECLGQSLAVYAIRILR